MPPLLNKLGKSHKIQTCFMQFARYWLLVIWARESPRASSYGWIKQSKSCFISSSVIFYSWINWFHRQSVYHATTMPGSHGSSDRICLTHNHDSLVGFQSQFGDEKWRRVPGQALKATAYRHPSTCMLADQKLTVGNWIDLPSASPGGIIRILCWQDCHR